MNVVSRTRSRTIWRRTGVALGALAGLLLLLEAVARVRFYAKYGTFVRIHTFATDAASGLTIPPPGRDTGAIRIDSRGFRNPELEVPKPAGRIRIAFLGASTTFCAEASSNDATWPSLVERELRARHASSSIDFVNAGVAGYLIEDMRRNLEYRVAPLGPDVIVIYEATNDLTHDTRDLAREQGVYTEHSDREGWLAEVSLFWHLVEKNLLVRSRSRSLMAARDRLVLDPARIAPGYEARLRALVSDARRIAPVVAVVTFSQRLRRGMNAEESEASCVTHAYYMPYMSTTAILDGFEAYNAAIRSVARSAGVVLVEVENEIPGDAAHFADSVHFTDLGCQLMARRVVAGLENAPEFQALVRR